MPLDPVISEILTSQPIKDELNRLATLFATQAAAAADAAVGDRHPGEPAEYGHDQTVGSDRARSHVWAINGTAIHAERSSAAPLLNIVAAAGPAVFNDSGAAAAEADASAVTAEKSTATAQPKQPKQRGKK